MTVPTYDFFENFDLDKHLDEAVDHFIFLLKSKYFWSWEAIVREEEGLPVSEVQKEILFKINNFRGENNNRIFYINELPRPNEPWYEIALKIVPHLLKKPFRTDVIYSHITLEAWPALVDALETHTADLSLPEKVESPLDVFPLDLQHRLNLQVCFEALYGLGQEEELTLENEEQHSRIEDFISDLRKYRDSVLYFNLTFKKLLNKVIMPEKDEKIFISLMMAQLGMTSPQQNLARFLDEANFSEMTLKA